MLKGIAFLIFFAALLVPPKVALTERKGGSAKRAAVMRLVGVVITTAITVFFYWLDLDGLRPTHQLPSFPLLVVFFGIGYLVGYVAEMTLWRPFFPGFFKRK